mgnify:CR=1 FL=1
MKVTERKIADLIAAEYNPRELTPDQFKQLKDSLTRFGVVDPIIVNTHPERKDIIVGGHQRTKVWEEMGNKEIPTVEVNLTPEKERELNIRLNKNSGQWDEQALQEHFNTDELINWGFDNSELEFFINDESNQNGTDYTREIKAPTYEPKNEKPKESELFDEKKTKELIKQIEQLNLNKTEKNFLIKAAQRHTVFNYEKIADYYAHSNKEVQELMENSALIIIDFNKAIENGFVEMNKKFQKLYSKEYGQ